jgi:hypothetical protein
LLAGDLYRAATFMVGVVLIYVLGASWFGYVARADVAANWCIVGGVLVVAWSIVRWTSPFRGLVGSFWVEWLVTYRLHKALNEVAARTVILVHYRSGVRDEVFRTDFASAVVLTIRPNLRIAILPEVLSPHERQILAHQVGLRGASFAHVPAEGYAYSALVQSLASGLLEAESHMDGLPIIEVAIPDVLMRSLPRQRATRAA